MKKTDNEKFTGRCILNEKKCEKLILKHKGLVDYHRKKMVLCNRAYDHIFDQIRASEKKSPTHIMLLYIENLLNDNSMHLKERINYHTGQVEYYINKKASLE